MLFIGITSSSSSELSACVLSVSLIQSINGAKILNITCLFFLFAATSAFAATVMASLEVRMQECNHLTLNLALQF